ncbi:hypothetical protein ACGCUQ_06325 [Eubacteriales bacterium KG127]
MGKKDVSKEIKNYANEAKEYAKDYAADVVEYASDMKDDALDFAEDVEKQVKKKAKKFKKDLKKAKKKTFGRNKTYYTEAAIGASVVLVAAGVLLASYLIGKEE